ncbi:MAG: hypothetical protein AAB870_03410 [Patescibacteria group bacterium]
MIFDLDNTNWEQIKIGVQQYLYIMDLVRTSNVQKNEEFQRKFNGFYRIMKKSKEFYEALYQYLEDNKNKEISFEQTLGFFEQKFHPLEASFSSKIVATINPNFPIWDSEVLARLNLKAPRSQLARDIRFKEIVKMYNEIVSWYSDFLGTEEAKRMIKIFDEKIGTVDITDIKRIDFILWQTR